MPDKLWKYVSLSSDHVFVLKLDLLEDSTLSTHYQKIESLNPSCHFCLLINSADKVDEAILTNLISFFFFPNYKKQRNTFPEIFVHFEFKEELQHFAEVIKEAAKAQGFTDISIHGIQESKGNCIEIYSANDIENIRTAYQNRLNDPVTAADEKEKLLISILQKQDISIINDLLQKEEGLFSQQNHSLYTLKQQIKELRLQLEQSELTLKAAEQEISNQVSHINILRSSSQATHLQYYYNNEYEVLPLWYKQLGHLIKVIMGKRKFSSLFNENKKKYKK